MISRYRYDWPGATISYRRLSRSCERAALRRIFRHNAASLPAGAIFHFDARRRLTPTISRHIDEKFTFLEVRYFQTKRMSRHDELAREGMVKSAR